MDKVAVALGSNLGDRLAHLQFGLAQLGLRLEGLISSSILETAPVDVPGPQPPYLNAVAIGRTSLTPEALLRELSAIEQARGRERLSPRASRTLDLDLILFGDRIVQSPALVVPHPRFRERRFVLEPLAEVAPEWVDPVSGKTIGALLEACRP